MTTKGVWDIQQVRDKLLAGDNWERLNKLWTWGRNNQGQLGNDNTTDYSSPVQVPGSWEKVMRKGNSFRIAIKNGGELWAWGANTTGQLGQNSTTRYSSPVQVGSGTDWASNTFSMSNGPAQVAVIKTDGTLWTWGKNRYGSLGLNHASTYQSSPTKIPGTSWAKVSCSNENMAAIKTDGTLWAWGYGGDGQLGQGNNQHRSSPVQMGSGTDWREVNCATSWFNAVTNPGQLYHTGKKGEGNAGDGTSSGSNTSLTSVLPGKNIQSIANAAEGSACTTTDGKLWTWGNNNSGCLGQNNQTQYSSPKQVGSDTTWYKVGSSGSYYTFSASKTDGTLWGMGYNDYGSLGQNNTTQYSSPVQIPGTWAWDRAVRSYGVGIKTGY